MRGEGFGALLSYPEAVKILKENAPSFEKAEEVSLSEGLMRVVAEDVEASLDVPHFARAAMDGYAVLAADTFGASYQSPVKLLCLSSIKPGEIPDIEVSHGKCVRISTGAAMPAGADAVIMVEETEREGEVILCHRAVAPQTNVVGVGSDFAQGSVVVKANTLLKPRHLGALAATGVSSIRVLCRPRVTVISTGGEIVEPTDHLPIGKVFNINGITLSTALREYGCEPIDFGVVEDDEEALKQALKKAVNDSDLVILSGGSSLGEGDIVVRVFERLGRLLFHGIAVKPGKPTSAAVIDGKLVIGLPGYPTSALSNFYILVLPLIEQMLKVRFHIRSVKAKLAKKVLSTVGRYEFLPVRVEKGEVYPLMRGSSAISSLSLADGFVEIPENVEVLSAGTEVEVKLF